MAELLQQLLEEEIRDELNPPAGTARPLSILLIEMQRQLMECEDVDRAQCTAMIKAQHTFHVSAKMTGGDDDRDRRPCVVRFVSLKVADEPGLEGRMKRTGDDAQHSERGWLFVKREAKVTRYHVLVLSMCASRDMSDGRQCLPGFRAENLPVTIDTGPIPVDEGHRFTADPALRRGALVDDR